ncbi:hypothetical protein GYMLUDRAFT_672988 [Collybiopsis luxurians FD-317 M1]|uniref:Uncharacterized protein n=1 Tax=Collybiopsis luxurians FD-317 M1 TaxID=944289 RepID=A0A0D0CLY3_9AGAR|nr:hypothetical protein GYMLUDRAFT_672988 [Collybiopsis luxurians FD-317 M1]
MSSRSVLQGTLVTSAVCACGTGIHGIVTLQPNATLRTVSAGINGGISGATFFSIREFAISPFLVSTLPWSQYERRRKTENQPHSLEELKRSDIRADRLLDSGVSGFITGGILRGFTRNFRGALPGAVSAGVLCTLLQYMYNESRVVRLEYLIHQRQNHQQPSTSQTPNVNSSKPWTERIFASIGIKSLSDEEYLASLKKQRDVHLERIAEIEDEMKKEK